MPPEEARTLHIVYVEILKLLFSMSNHSEQWVINEGQKRIAEEPGEYTVI